MTTAPYGSDEDVAARGRAEFAAWMRERDRQARSLRRQAKQLAAVLGYRGSPGGWVYRVTADGKWKPACQGWDLWMRRIGVPALVRALCWGPLARRAS